MSGFVQNKKTKYQKIGRKETFKISQNVFSIYFPQNGVLNFKATFDSLLYVAKLSANVTLNIKYFQRNFFPSVLPQKMNRKLFGSQKKNFSFTVPLLSKTPRKNYGPQILSLHVCKGTPNSMSCTQTQQSIHRPFTGHHQSYKKRTRQNF